MSKLRIRPSGSRSGKTAHRSASVAFGDAYGPVPEFLVGKPRRRPAVRSANDNEARRALRIAFKGIAPIRRTAQLMGAEKRMRGR